jgi:anti-sigma B factor antagonist
MNQENSGIQAGEDNGLVVVRILGKGTHQNSHFLKKYLNHCLEQKKGKIQIDLSACTYMDSTFLGTLAGLGGKMKEKGLPPITLANATERVHGMIDALGIGLLFEMKQTGAPVADGKLEDLQKTAVSQDVKAREMLEAHQKLVEVSRENEAKFKDVIALLREEVSKQTSK